MKKRFSMSRMQIRSCPGVAETGSGARMRRFLWTAGIVLLVLTLPSCRRTAERLREKIRLEAIESVRRQGLSGAEIVARVANDTRYELRLERATADIFYGADRVSRITLCEGVGLDPRTTALVTTRWRVRIDDLLALYALARRVQRRDLSEAFISFSAEGRGGPVPVEFSRERMPLSEFMRIFGLELQDVENYLKQ